MPTPKTPVSSAMTIRPAEGAWRQLVHCMGLLERIMQPYFAQFGISGSQWGVLRTLYRTEQENIHGLRLTDLSERLLIRPPSVSGVVDRLERAGLVVRDGSPTDLRAKQVALTSRGRQLVERVLAIHGDQIEQVLSGLTTDEQGHLHRLLLQMGKHLEELLVSRTAANIG